MPDLDMFTGADIDGFEHVEQSIEVILTTRLEERVEREWFGNPGTRLLGENATAGTILRWFTIVYMLIELHEPRFKLVRFLVDSVLRDGGATFTMEGQYRPFALNGFVQAKLFLSVVGNAVRIRSAV